MKVLPAIDGSLGSGLDRSRFFRRLDRERLDRARRTSALDEERRELGALTGLRAGDVEALQARGFRPETIALLPLVPLVQLAWAERHVSDDERTMIVQLARARAIREGSPADQQLAEWLREPPRDEIFAWASRFVGAMLQRSASVVDGLTADALVEYCERIAAVSGFLGGLSGVGFEERDLLTRIARDLKHRTQ
jgi:hypothetical protein